MKPQHLILPVLAAAALGVGLPALAQQSGLDSTAVPPKAPEPPKEVRVATTVKAEGVPIVKIDGVSDEKLQKVLKEALEFKGSDEEFAKKAAGWKKEHGLAVTRKGKGHVVITRDGKEGAIKIEVMRGQGSSSVTSTERRFELGKADGFGETRELRIAPSSVKDSDKEARIEVRGLKSADGKKMMILKELPLVDGIRIEGGEGVRVFRFDKGRELSEKDRAALKKELQELRKQLRSLPKGEGRAFMFREGKAMNEKEMKEHTKGLKDLDIQLMPFASGKALSAKEMKVLEEQMKGFIDLDIAKIAPMSEGFAFAYGHGGDRIQGLSDADQKKMHDEIAKVHAEAQKKISQITAKYKAKAKSSK